MKLYQLCETLNNIMEGDPAQPLAELIQWPSEYEVEFLVPGGGDWSGMQVDVNRVQVDHKNRKVVIS